MENIFPLANPQIITNKEGKELGVFLDMKDYRLLEEKFEDLVFGAIANSVRERSEGFESLEDIKKELIDKRKNIKNKLYLY